MAISVRFSFCPQVTFQFIKQCMIKAFAMHSKFMIEICIVELPGLILLYHSIFVALVF